MYTRKNTKKVDIIIIAVILLIIAGCILLTVASPGAQKKGSQIAADTDGNGVVTYEDFIGKRIGIRVGSNFEPVTLEYFPDSEYFYFDTTSDLAVALQEDKIDMFLEDEPVARMIHSENSSLDYLRTPLLNDEYSFMFGKNNEKSSTLLKQFNEMLAEFKRNGRLDEITDKWFGTDDSAKTFDRTPSSGENGVITVAGMPDNVPFAYYLNNEFTGCAVELMTVFAQRYGYTLEFEQANSAALIAGTATGKYDIAIGSVSVTDERKESADFSDTVYKGGYMVMARSSDLGTKTITYKDYVGKRVGVETGSSFEKPTFEFLPDSEYFYFDTLSDLIMALSQDKIDCFVHDEPVIRMAHTERPEISYLPDVLRRDKYSFCFEKTGEKGEKLQKQFNEMLAELNADGSLESMRSKWFDGDPATVEIDRSGITGENGKLNVFVNPVNVPFAMIADGELKGYAVELMTEFCRRYGYDCNYEQANISSGLAGITTGIYDIGANNTTVTPEREESVRFSDPIYIGGISLAVKTSDITGEAAGSGPASEQSLFESIATSFEKNFIREDRWKLIVDGIGTTCFITVLSALFGSVLAFLVCMFRRTGSRLAGAISNIYVKLLQGTPIVVLLMILYYVVLGKSGLEAVWVAVIGFSLNFGAYASEIMRSGIESIDGGQREAALALGYNENQAFFRFIFPQAAVRFTPVYKQEIVSLLKSTSIVGYIAIQDLTKMSDIIRSRTYEAFFPLIATAIIYFILAWIISLAVKLILTCFDKKSRSRKTKKST